MTSQEANGKIRDYCIGWAHYITHDGFHKVIKLIDAIAPLRSIVQAKSKLLLSKEPIVRQWPLPIQEREESGRKKRRKICRDDTDSRLEDLNQLLDVEIPLALRSLAEKVQSSRWLTKDVSVPYVVASLKRLPTISWPGLQSRCGNDKVHGKSPLATSKNFACDADHLLHRLVSNPSDQIMEISLPSYTVALPSRSAFLITDLLQSQIEQPVGWDHIVDHAAIYAPSLILLDPPYPNLSAERLSKQVSQYAPVSDLYDLWKLRNPVQQLLNNLKDGDEALVGCWVTNHAKIQRFVLQKLFPAWGLQHIGQLVWVKVTAGDGTAHEGGRLIYPLNNKQGRKPYEILFLGQRRQKTVETIDTELFASVPLEHSRKPYVLDLLRKHLKPDKPINVYEFFARSTCAGPDHDGVWVSIGNEAIKFNQEGIRFTQTDHHT